MQKFKNLIWEYYREHKRALPWRRTKDPYKILVSEVMLQQTQVSRVLIKYEEFVKNFPSFKILSRASNRDVLSAWQGLGYNRRALNLSKTAQIVVENYNGRLPNNPKILETFPGVGKATANAVCAFAFNQPTIFIETNIRRVFIHHFFKDKDKVSDRKILPYVSQSVDHNNPREWYFALMDFGTMLGRLKGNANRKSMHYAKQSPFEGSNRRLRGIILRELLAKPQLQRKEVYDKIGYDKKRVKEIFSSLVSDGFLQEKSGWYSIK